jgi:hypothetical protein
MKDFLQGRPSVASTRSSSPNISLPSNLPPISSSVAVEETTLEDSLATDQPLEDLAALSNGSCGEHQVEVVPDVEGRVGHIVVTCRCGEKITLQCNY